MVDEEHDDGDRKTRPALQQLQLQARRSTRRIANIQKKISHSSSSKQQVGGALAGTGSSSTEALIGLLSGLAFGMVSPIVGHPLDLVKTKMQACQSSHIDTNVVESIQFIYRNDGGIRGFYRGFVPPFIASMMFRSVQFSMYSGAYAFSSHYNLLNDPVPFTGGLRPSVLVGAMAAASGRAIIETPLEFIKVRIIIAGGNKNNAEAGAAAAGPQSRTGMSKKELIRMFVKESPLRTIQNMYSGFTPTLLRSMGLLGSFFIMVDYSTRYIPHIVNAPLFGPFFKGGICATLSWGVCFPFETAKSIIQADTTGKYQRMRNATWIVIKQLYHERGIVKGLYRGFLPGASRSFFANGASMLVYSWFQGALRSKTDNDDY